MRLGVSSRAYQVVGNPSRPWISANRRDRDNTLDNQRTVEIGDCDQILLNRGIVPKRRVHDNKSAFLQIPRSLGTRALAFAFGLQLTHVHCRWDSLQRIKKLWRHVFSHEIECAMAQRQWEAPSRVLRAARRVDSRLLEEPHSLVGTFDVTPALWWLAGTSRFRKLIGSWSSASALSAKYRACSSLIECAFNAESPKKLERSFQQSISRAVLLYRPSSCTSTALLRNVFGCARVGSPPAQLKNCSCKKLADAR